MSNRNKRSRSTFDDPQGFDTAYRIGSAAADLWAAHIERKQPGFRADQVPPHRKKRATINRRRQFLAQRDQLNQPRDPAPAQAQVRGAMPRRRSYKRRRIGSRGRFGRFRKRSGRVTRRTRSSGRVKRRFGRKRYGRKSSKRLGVFSKTFRHILAKPAILEGESMFALNNYGDNLQGKCSWAGIAMCWTPLLYDQHISTQENVALGQAERTVDVLMQKAEGWLQFKNMSNSRCDVTVYKLFPRRDIPQNTLRCTGIFNGAANDNILVQGATTVTQATFPGAPASWRLPTWDEHNYDIFTNTIVSDMFKVKKVMRKFLDPGQFVVLKQTDKRERVRGMGDFGLLSGVGQTISANFQWLKENGPILLFRVQGSNQHNSTLAVPVKTDGAVGSTMGCYNVEFYYRSKTTSYGNVGTAPKRVVAMTSNRLSTFAVANEQGFEMRVAQNQPMDIQ